MESAMLHHVMREARPVSLGQHGELGLAFPSQSSFLKRKAEDESHRRTVSTALRTVCGWPLRPMFELRDLEPEPQTAAPPPTEEEWVARFVAELDAEELPADAEGSAA